ncbi:MAG TPA: hypothetical protein VF487_06045 [Chitinophagaceae bacterium]
MRGFIFIVCLFICSVLKSQIDSSLAYSFLKTKYSLFKDKIDIPKSFFKGYKKITNKDFVIANTGDTFNPTDVLYSGIPNKKLMFLGLDSTKKTGFILYQQGGQVVTSHILLFDVSSKRKPKLFGLYLNKEPRNFEELKVIISNLSKHGFS